MFAVIRTGGKQLRVAPNDRIRVEKLIGDAGTSLSFAPVLLADGASPPLVGTAVPSSARVWGEIVAQEKGDKVLIFKKKRRKNHRRLRGHRQLHTLVRITGISLTGEPPAVGVAEAVATTPTTTED
jgi:large subunit ribosomal protein L21